MHDRLESRLLALARDTAALSEDLGYGELADRIEVDVAGSADRPANVVVVGEKKRGKSSLLNALVGQRDLLPVDADVATSCFLTLRHGTGFRVVAHDAEHPEGIEIERDEIAEYASVEGNRDPDDHERLLHEGVTSVEVELESPLLARGLVLVDTPGVGGLEAGHTEVTLATLRRADALVFVVDPDSPLRAPELRFLERATERIATVLFVMTKIDLYPGWQRVLEDDRGLIARHAPVFAGRPWAPVSSELRLEALEVGVRGDEVRSADMFQRSGFAALVEMLDEEVIQRADVLGLANVLHAAASALDRMATSEQTRIRAAAGDPRLVDELEAKQDRLRELTQGTAAWRQRSSEGFRRLDQDLQRDLQSRLRSARRGAEDRIDGGAPGFAESVERDYPAQLQAIWIDMTTNLQRGVADLVLDLAREFEADGADALALEVDLPQAVREMAPVARSEASESSFVDGLGPTMTGVAGAFWAARALAAAGISFPPLLIFGAGAALAHHVFGERSRQAELARTKRDLRTWLTRVGEDAGQAMAVQLRDTALDAPARAEDFFVKRLREHQERLQAEIGECRLQVQAEQVERARVHADAEARLRRIDELAGVAAALFRAVDEAAAPTATLVEGR